jgi:hypothetical protein
MRLDYPKWLAAQQYSEGTQNTQIYRVKKVEECYGDLERHFTNGTYEEIIDSLEYSTSDERVNKPNPSKLAFEGNINLRNNLQSYKSAAVRYWEFLKEDGLQSRTLEAILPDDQEMPSVVEDFFQQRFSLERDMQASLRRNIKSLDSSLRIIDGGDERAVNSGLIDITCENDEALVVVELKAGKADNRAIGQILGYMGDLYEEEGGKLVRGILVAHDFDRRTRAAARVVPTLTLKKYSIEFRFIAEP